MIIKMVFYSLFIIVYHVLLIALPVNYFLIGLKIPFLMDLFPWLFYPFLLFSPILTVLLSIRSTPSNIRHFAWIFPISVSLIGYTPVIGFYFFISSLTNIRDCCLMLFFPIILGLISFWGSRFLKSSRFPLGSVKSRQKSVIGHSEQRGVK